MNFNTIGIICEYNPFHFGHKYHIQKTKEITGCENIVCVMSGSLVQRGECAIFDKWQRAKSAIFCGADLVVELPSYYVLQSADIFAKGGVEILNKMSIIDGISFGCECGDVSVIKAAAEIMTNESSDYHTILKEELKKGIGFPKASEVALEKCMTGMGSVLSKPNNTLATGYIKAINNLSSPMEAFAIQRDNDYHSGESLDGFASASHIRSLMKENKNYLAYCDDYSGINTFSLKNAESLILGFLRMVNEKDLQKIKGYEPGLDILLKTAAAKACTLDEMISLCVCKRYTIHRIKRFVLSAILGLNFDASAQYLRVLAANKKGTSLLAKMKEKSTLKIITKAADYKEDNKMFKLDIKASDFASLCSDDTSKRFAGRDYTTSPYILKNQEEPVPTSRA